MRTDIQALRGVAVLFAMLYHAFPSRFSAGYLGVDVFFVISGYLMTRLLAKEMTAGSFSLRAFYFRRAKRILPATYVTLAATALLSVFFLTMTERYSLAKQLAGALTFTTNFALWQSTGYFALPAENKPLLHFWSLAIEEQFYLVLPVFFLVLPRRFWLRAVGLVCVASAVACVALIPFAPDATFYLFPTRDWELSIGAFAALCGVTLAGRPRTILTGLALAVLLVIPIRPLDHVHPRLDALLVCLATAVLLLADHPRFQQSRIARAFAPVGDISFSLYLVHWPLLAFANNAWFEPVPTAVRLALLAASVPLAVILHRGVERPLWRSPIVPGRRPLVVIAASTAALALSAFVVARFTTAPVAHGGGHRRNFGLSDACNFRSAFEPLGACRSAPSPRILVWGDSLAMHLVAGIDASTNAGVLQATMTRCGPLLDLAPYERPEDGIGWARNCVAFNDSVIEYLRRDTSIDTVVLSSAFSAHLNGPGATPSTLASALTGTVTRLHALGKRVVLVSPPPEDWQFDAGECVERQALGLPWYGRDRRDCAISAVVSQATTQTVRRLLDEAATASRAGLFSFDPYLCSDGWCRTEIDGRPLYLDSVHLTSAGSALLGKRIALAEQLLTLAK